jgi:hypothetical protein
VSLEDQNATIIPQLGFRNWANISYGQTLSEIFNALNKTDIVRNLSSEIESHQEEFLLNDNNFVIVKPQNVTKRSPQELYHRHWSIYYVDFNISHISHLFGTFVQPYFDDFEGLQKTDVWIDCQNIKMQVCVGVLTYTTKITKLQPPPYDTNCLLYKLVYNYSSKENCISECLNNFTERHGLMIASNVIKRSKYENSSLKIIPGFFRTMQDGDVEISTESINNIWKRWMNMKRMKTENVALLRKITDILPSYKTHWKSCMNLCQRPDCVKESYVTIVQTTVGFDKTSSVTARILELALFPPNDQTTIVTSLPKMNFIDFLTQILSCVSFWFGFCPLQIIDWVKRYNTKRKDEEHENRIRRLEHKNRTLQHIVEQNAIGINRRLHLIERAQGYNNLPRVE